LHVSIYEPRCDISLLFGCGCYAEDLSMVFGDFTYGKNIRIAGL